MIESELKGLIMVSSPYNCLYDYETLKDGGLKARVKNEFLYPDEGGPIGAAEVGRHIAILGSIALAKAMGNESPMYFLAVKAGLNRSNSKVYKSNFLELKVRPITFNNRSGSIAGIVRDDHAQLVYVVDVDYQVVSIPLFEKLFFEHRNQRVGPVDYNPYVERKELRNVVFEPGVAVGDFGIVEEVDCAGHFENAQALPVAIIGNLYSALGIQLCKNESGDIFQKYTIESARINAFRLAFAGEYVTVRAEIKKRKSSAVVLVACQAFVGDELISDAEIMLRGVVVPAKKRTITSLSAKGNRSL